MALDTTDAVAPATAPNPPPNADAALDPADFAADDEPPRAFPIDDVRLSNLGMSVTYALATSFPAISAPYPVVKLPSSLEP